MRREGARRRPRAGWSHYHLALLPPFLLTGVLPMDREATAGRGWSGAWVLPVGDPYRFGGADGRGEPFQVTRGLIAGGPHECEHQGADLSNRRVGERARAAAGGLVAAADSGPGYGTAPPGRAARGLRFAGPGAARRGSGG